MKNIYSCFSVFLLMTSVVLFGGCSDSDKISEKIIEYENGVNITPSEGVNLYGFIGDEDHNPISGVVVSDGFSSTVTNEKGVYEMVRNEKSTLVYYSTPSDYEVNVESSAVCMASFYQSIIADKERYDFKLTRLINEENDFTLLCIGDPQVKEEAQIQRFRDEIMDDIKDLKAVSSKPIYAIAMGDMVHDKPNLLESMKIAIGSVGIPVFTIIGNHDKVASLDSDEPRNADLFCKTYGPLNYSFDRGNVHFVCLDNVLYTDASSYSAGFTDEQVEWLKSDLQYVSKSKMIVLSYHMPMRNSNNIVIRNKTRILEQFEGFAGVHLMCGHTHYNDNFEMSSPISAYEHIHAASCGAWWKSVINGDGTPNGYAVYEISGSQMNSWYYKAAKFDKSHQFRLHWGDTVFGAVNGGYSYGKPNYTLIANVWNADDSWVMEVYLDGVLKGSMKKLAIKKDAWSMGYHIGMLDLSTSTYTTTTNHLYYYNVKDSYTDLKVVIKDRFGNVYEETKVVTTLDTAEKYLN